MNVEIYKNEDYNGTCFLLKSSFGSDKDLVITPELMLRVIIRHPENHGEIIAHAALYVREMYNEGDAFIAGIIGDVAVSPEFQRQGLATKMLSVIHGHLKKESIYYSFLFAYQTEIYKKSGYHDLVLPIYYFDVLDNRWNTYLYNGAMLRCVINNQLRGMINFNGRTY
ncbi:GNAT family N-acetyltransferase [Cedecea neteri]|uniref:GNAT family N-acetyltransferase n=1 Tax=Cedecea neteri TaxID=158822 RepID=UPI0004F907E3|nr:GNAT family N-acetyltransferase [Cedecea neteri]AIR64298.1 hypothetical protein LH86_04135 [Cedecea neteri]